MVDMVVDTCMLVLVMAPGARVTGFWPPITPRNPKGTIAERVIDPSKPFLLSRIMLVEFANPATTVIEYGLAYTPKSAWELTVVVNRAELLRTFFPAKAVPVTIILYVPIEAFLAACTVVIEVAVPPACTLTPRGLKMTVIPLVTCAVSATVPVKP